MICLALLESLGQKKTIDELIEKANSAADKIHDKEKIEKYKNLFIENIQFKQKKFRVLEEKLFKYKFELENIDQNE